MKKEKSMTQHLHVFKRKVKKQECPHIDRRCAGDECLDFCDIHGHLCELESGNVCGEWKEIKREWSGEMSLSEALKIADDTLLGKTLEAITKEAKEKK